MWGVGGTVNKGTWVVLWKIGFIMIEPLGINNFIASFRIISRIVFDIQVESTHKCREKIDLYKKVKSKLKIFG